jgi:hypothetical protein
MQILFASACLNTTNLRFFLEKAKPENTDKIFFRKSFGPTGFQPFLEESIGFLG